MLHRTTAAAATSRSRHWVRAAVAASAATTVIVCQLVAASGSGAAQVERPGPHGNNRALAAAPLDEHPLPLTTRYHELMNGSITRIGNTLMTCDEKKAPLVKGAASCLNARKGLGKLIYNNNYRMRYVNQYPGNFPLPPSEGGGVEHLYSSSGAVLKLIPGSEVRYARLYWGGTRGLGKVKLPLSKVDGVLFKAPDGKGYHEVNAKISEIGYMTGVGEGNAKEHGYQASADVTDIVRAAGHGTGNGNYIVADMDSVVASHSWGGWSLVVAYANCDKPLRDIELTDGFQIELPDSPALVSKVPSFTVPQSGPIHAKLGFIAYDGDRSWTGDTVQVKSTNGPLTTLSTPDKPANDFMNSTIEETSPSDKFARTPNYVNQMGYDSDRIDISNLLRTGDTDLTFTFNTKKDGYQLGAVYSYVNMDDSTDVS